MVVNVNEIVDYVKHIRIATETPNTLRSRIRHSERSEANQHSGLLRRAASPWAGLRPDPRASHSDGNLSPCSLCLCGIPFGTAFPAVPFYSHPPKWHDLTCHATVPRQKNGRRGARCRTADMTSA